MLNGKRIEKMKNKKNITIQELKTYFNKHTDIPYYEADSNTLIYSMKNCSQHTNLSNNELGLYAYNMQSNLSILPPFNCVVKEELELHCIPFDVLDIRKEELKIVDGYWNYELSIRAWHRGIGHPIVLRNGFLLHHLLIAGIENLDDLSNFNAKIIYLPKKINPEIISFVGFVKK